MSDILIACSGLTIGAAVMAAIDPAGFVIVVVLTIAGIWLSRHARAGA
ncbi:MAG: hypothetical protein WD490_03660 [Opitutales bacterium]